MQYRKFGDSHISALGFGAMRLPTENEKIREAEAIDLIRYAIDHGVTYVDTAYFYHGGNSEVVVGKALRDGYRERVTLATKSPLVQIETREDFDRIFEEQCRRLQTDHIDCYLLHAVNLERWETVVKPNGLPARMAELKKEGRISRIGFSFHDNAKAFQKILSEFSECEFCQIQFNYIDIENQAGQKGLELAHQKGLDVIVMEPLLGGKLASPYPEVAKALGTEKSPVEAALDFLWDKKEVSLVLSGMSNMEQLRQNLEYADRSAVGMLGREEAERYRKAKEAYDAYRPISCTACKYCMPCPQGIEIPSVFKTYNDNLKHPYAVAKEQYHSAGHRAGACIGCGRCEKNCPQHLEIRKLLKEIHETYDGGKA